MFFTAENRLYCRSARLRAKASRLNINHYPIHYFLLPVFFFLNKKAFRFSKSIAVFMTCTGPHLKFSKKKIICGTIKL